MSAIYCPHCAVFLIVGFQHFEAAFDCPACAKKISPDISPLPAQHVEMYLRMRRPLRHEEKKAA
jgi:hypothetical protein